LASLNNFSRLSCIEAVPSFLVPVSDVILAGGEWLRVCEPDKGVVWLMGPRLTGLHLKGTLVGKLFTILIG